MKNKFSCTSCDLLDAFPDGVLVLTRDLTVIFWNSCLEEWTGIKRSQIIGKPIVEFFPHLNLAKYSERIKDIVDQKQKVVFSSQIHKYLIPCQLSKGKHRLQHSTGVPFNPAELTETCALFFIKDVSIQVERNNEYEQILKGLNVEIENRKKIENELKAAKELAEKMNLAKSQFLSQMSHELRTPLNSILGFSQLLGMDFGKTLTKTQKDNISRIINSGGHLLTLIDEILDLSKIESGKINLSTEPVNGFTVIRDVMLFSLPIANKYGIQIINETRDDDFFVMADKTRLKQIIINFVTNAIKYNCEKGNVILSLQKINDNRLRFNVRDTGAGIPKEKYSDLFEPFNRLNADKSNIEGTGIGLTIAKKLTTLMQGSIGVESVVGEGSCFFIELPICSKTAAKISDFSELEIEIHKNEPNGAGNYVILYIEDNPDNLEFIKQILSIRKRVKMISAHEAMVGIELATVHTPNLILMDINLPGMDGLAALKFLKENDKTKDIPIVAVSANAMKMDINKAIEAGFESYITKPINVSDFLKKIDSFMSTT